MKDEPNGTVGAPRDGCGGGAGSNSNSNSDSRFQPDAMQSFAPIAERSPSAQADISGSAPTVDIPNESSGDRVANLSGRSGPGSRSVGRVGMPEQPGDEIGPWTLIDQIGRGSFGEVWRVRRDVPFRQLAALKILRPGKASDELRARFRLEREVLGRLNHPYVANILDGGESPVSGMPYLVTQLVHGKPIGAFCDERKLDLRERLDLFLKICEAVSHAHEKSIVHRDLKPDNILAFDTSDGFRSVKVIDFGVAKLVDSMVSELESVTELGRPVGTYEYMSPEQVSTEVGGIDARSDVYSLGVVLYELLAGTRPHDLAEARRKRRDDREAAIHRVIREVDPPPPSKRLSTLGASDSEGLARIAAMRRARPELLASELRGELEWIPMMAMRKEPQNRYRTVAHLADDVRNYLENRPLLAGPPTIAYRTRKFVRRNRAGVAIAASGVMGIGLLVAASIATLSTQKASALSERNAAIEDQRTLLRETAISLLAADEADASSEASRTARAESLAMLTERWRKFCTREDPAPFDAKGLADLSEDLALYAETAFAASNAASTERAGRASANREGDRTRLLAESRAAAERIVGLGVTPSAGEALLCFVRMVEADRRRVGSAGEKATPDESMASYRSLLDDLTRLAGDSSLDESVRARLASERTLARRQIADLLKDGWLAAIKGDVEKARRLWSEQWPLLETNVLERRTQLAAAQSALEKSPESVGLRRVRDKARQDLGIVIERQGYAACYAATVPSIEPEVGRRRELARKCRDLMADYRALYESVPDEQLSGNDRMELARALSSFADWEIDLALALTEELPPTVEVLDRLVSNAADEFLGLLRDDGPGLEYLQRLRTLQNQHLGLRRALKQPELGESAQLPASRRLELLDRIRSLRLDAERSHYIARVPQVELRAEWHAVVLGNLSRSALAASEARPGAVATLAQSTLDALAESLTDFRRLVENDSKEPLKARTAALNLLVQWEYAIAALKRLESEPERAIADPLKARRASLEAELAALGSNQRLVDWKKNLLEDRMYSPLRVVREESKNLAANP
jgi:serine/threonine protein kinase